MDSNFIAEPQQNFNPLQQVQQVQGIQGQMLANANARKTMAANTAVSQALQQATDPDTGQVDYAKLHQLVASNPVAAYNLNEAESTAQGTQNAATANQQQVLSLTQDRLATVGQRLQGLLANPNTGPDDVKQTFGQLVKDKIISPDRAMDEIQNVPSDPSKVHEYLYSHAQQLASAQMQLQMAEGDWQQTNLGGHIVYTQRNPMTQGGTGTAAVAATELTPGEKAQQVQTIDPSTGRPILQTQGQVLQREGVNDQGNAQPNDYSIPGVDRPAGQQPGTVTAGPSQQEQQAWTAATQRQQQREQAALDVPQSLASLQQAGTALANLKDTDWASGPKSGAIANIVGTLNTLGIHVDANSMTNRATAVKMLENAVNVSAQDAGFNGSDARLDAWKGGQPDPDKMPTQALKSAMAYVGSQRVGSALMSQYVHNYAAQNGPNTVAQAEQNWAQHYDANAMYMATLPAAQRARALAKLPAPAQAEVRQHMADMIQNGLVKPQDIARYGQIDAGE